MDKQDAIKCLKSMQQWIPDWDDREDGLSYWDAIDMAIAALDTPNKPLTCEQLREMDGDKIAIHYIGECAGFYEDEIAPYYGDQEQYIQRYNGMLRACDLPLKYYGTQWTATLYRRPLEGEA